LRRVLNRGHRRKIGINLSNNGERGPRRGRAGEEEMPKNQTGERTRSGPAMRLAAIPFLEKGDAGTGEVMRKEKMTQGVTSLWEPWRINYKLAKRKKARKGDRQGGGAGLD